ncbi:ABC transporter substrate-binding protein [Clostridium beijerinckii]|uniref:Putative ABC transporter substrate-binding protein YesO n=1 Tax=Clostridium beijerinckii TaxID=1520 RepID=A0A1S8SCS1_CLOBE|nr:sugar ABC transporter substrate-binding protein [Clostridium beijerinckii]NRY60240.1 multiple sugar transport system substrate-binding protein [Clostridium beijerinckii]OOM63436.1 putative ABC transporter substrate-binding protein YesO [Clostridium beijerinckii]
MKMKKLISMVIAFTLTATSLIGCGSSGGDSKAQGGADSSGKTTLKMAVWDKDKTAYLQPAIDAYKSKDPNVEIELVDISSAEYQDKLSVMLSGGSDDIDLITVKDTPGYSSMVNKKQLEPLDSYISKDEVKLDSYSGTAEQLKVEDKLYALPFRSDFWVLYYNKDLFDKAGIAYPTNDITWTQYEELAKKIASGEGTNRVYGTHDHTWRSTVQLPAVLDGKNTIIQKDYSFLKPFYEMALRMQNDKVMMDYASLKTGSIHYSGVFENNQTAMLPMGTWFMGQLMADKAKGTTNVNWGIVKYPHADSVKPGTTIGTITSLAINSKSSKKDAAWNFLKFFTGEEGAATIAKTGTLPAIKSGDVINTITSQKGFPTDESSKKALETEKTYLEMPVNAKSAAIEVILNEEHDLIMTGSTSVDDGLKELSKRVSEELEK